MDISVRQARPGDQDALALVGAATFLESYAGVVDGGAIIRHCAERHTPEVYAQALETPGQALWLAEQDPGAAPVGYLHLTEPDLPVETRAADLEIKRIYVLASLHRSGLGRRFLDAARDHAGAAGARRLLLGVYQGNTRALAFYDRMGFEKIGTRQFDVGGRIYDDWVLALTV
ncbi:GNAT family N-acetyltransferase [Oceanicaulis alexandrii]|uniref:GNAT family N-acetyltransferase n=1 Tax=Oceanicaulis alexandrii TaxID=153233 RepID=UPI0003B5A82D|nr:GNAT family N-acetyltransferase [Oceanicaulis alexandrii]